MIKKILYLFLSLSFIFFIVPTSRGFENNKENIIINEDGSKAFIPYTQENIINGRIKGGHDTLTAEGVQLKKEVHKGDDDEGRKFNLWANEDALPSLRTGAHDEDTNEVVNNIQPDPPIGPNGWGNYLYHYYNPNTDTGLKGVFKSTPERAGDYAQEIRNKVGCKDLSKLSPQDKNKIYDSFGRILHLLQDMGNSAHTNDDIHVFTSSIEDYVKDNWAEIVQSDSFKNAVTPEEYRKGNFDAVNPFHPKPLMKTLASVSSSYPTDGFWGKLTDEQVKEQVSNLIPWTTLMTAGYIDAVYKLMSGPGGVDCVEPPPGPSDPAGDHPDDRFDVSDEFYWEKEHKMGEKELADLYLRTAMKKGKMGVWYKKRFMEILFEGRARYKDAPQGIKDAIEVDFRTVGEKLERRRNQAESDWKGAPDVALFTNGFYNPSISLMLKIGEPVSFQDIDFNPEIVKDHPVLLVPTGGFYGLGNSSSSKAMLDEYVKNGGTLVVLTQQHGYDWEMLPVPVNPETGERKSVKGFGYQEDQSCSFNSVYIDTYHPILSVFSTSTANVGVDGYFTSYPEGSTILLRRTANGQPAMILYPYGQGQVIATTLYTDFAFAHGQANQAEINFVQNIISWAKKPDTLAEVKPGETVSVSVGVTNNTDTDAASVKFSILDPNRKAISEQTQATYVSAGQSVTISVSFTSTQSSTLGIYHVDHTLLDGQGNVIQPQAETDSGRFAVSNPPKSGTPDKPIWFSVSTSSQEVLFGAPFDYTFHVFNNTDQTPNLTIRNYLRHTARSHQWSIVAAPNQDTTVSGSDLFLDSFWMFETMEAVLYDESEKVIAKYDLSFKGVLPSTSVSVKTDKVFYKRNDPVTINASLKNTIPLNWQSDVKITVLDAQNNKIFEDPRTVAFSPNRTYSVETFFLLPPTLGPSTYAVRVEAWYGGRLISSASTKFEMLQSEIAFTPNLPSAFTSGLNTIPFVLSNQGRIGVYSGTLDVSLKDPGEGIVFSGIQPFALGIGESQTVNIPISISPLQFGVYTLSYSQSDETRTGNLVTISIPNTAAVTLSFDRPSYRIRETANLSVGVRNTGRFNLENAPLSVSVTDAGFQNTTSINLLEPGQTLSSQYAILIPETIAAGQHDGYAVLILAGGSTIAQYFKFNIPDSSLILEHLGPSVLNAGDMVDLVIENKGGVDTTYTSEKLMIIDNKGFPIFQGSATGIIMAGEKKVLTNIQIPYQTIQGPAFLSVEIRDSKTGRMVDLSKAIEITGLTAALQARTNKEAYLKAEVITGISSIENGQLGIEGGSLKVVVKKLKGVSTGQFTHFLPKKGWWSFDYPYGIAVGADGSVYVTDTNKHRIQKFDSNGNFIIEWGSYGSGDGQFNYADGIAVDSDGFVYVADTDNNRLQKFDSNGNFIAKWGNYGGGDGELLYPRGIAVGLDGSVYVADTGNNRIQKFGTNGSFITKWGGKGVRDGQFNSPSGIAVGSDGRVYVTDTNNNRIQKFDSNGNFIKGWGSYGSGDGDFLNPEGIAVGPDGSFYAVDAGNDRIQKFDSNGNFIMGWGSYGNGNGQFINPSGMAIGPDASVYVVDTENQRIQKFDNNGNFIMKWGSYGRGDGDFYFPSGIAIGVDGFVYVADAGNDRIQKFDRNGNFISKWGSNGSGDGEFYYPEGVAVGSDGSVYVADAGNNRIQKFDRNGNFISKWGSNGSEDGQFAGPTGIAVASDDSVYVVERYNPRIQKFDSNGNFIMKWEIYYNPSGEFPPAPGVAIGPNGSVYVAEAANHRIQQFDSNGNLLAEWGSYGSGDGQFNHPEGIAVDSNGFVYVADTDNNRIQKFDTFGNFVAKWGSENNGNGDGGFFYPRGLAVGLDGSMYVADTWNHRIQRMIEGIFTETLFETDIPINQPASTTQEYTAQIGTLNAAGKLYLQATLSNGLGETIAQASYSFYIIEGDTVLLFGTDKKVYKPGENVTITGQVENRAPINAEGMILSISSKLGTQITQLLNMGPFIIPSGGAQPFTFITTAGTEGTVTLVGTVGQNSSTLVEITDQYEVAKPKVSMSVAVPNVVGIEPFKINVEIKNIGKVEATTRIEITNDRAQVINDQTLTIAPGETKFWQESQQITGIVTYTLIFTGDLEQAITKTVSYGLAAAIAMNPQATYLEGNVPVPLTITNTGQLAETIEVNFELNPGAVKQSKTYFLPVGGSTTETLYFGLIEGDYQITASSQYPMASDLANFSVKKEDKMEMAVSIEAQADGFIPVAVNLINYGYNSIAGNIKLSAISGQGMAVWDDSQNIYLPYTPQPTPYTRILYINPSAIPPGSYTLRVELLSNSSQPLATYSSSFTVNGAAFQVAQFPAFQTFSLGQEATFDFRVKNTGSQGGVLEFNFKAQDLINLTKREWLKAGEERSIPFSFRLPEDLEEKDYFADYEMKGTRGQGVEGSRGQVKYHLAGINIAVRALLDKQYYQEGESAHLTLYISNPNAQSSTLNLFARVNYPGYESNQPFTLNISQTIAFDIPLAKITGEKLFFGIYHESGRSIHLNSLYIYKAGDVITITTDKQVYKPGETVSVAAAGNISGTLTLTAPNYEETVPFNNTATRNFPLPSTMTAGTYYVSYQLSTSSGQNYTGTRPFDVDGIRVKVKEATLDKAKYAPSDTINLTLSIESNQNLGAILKTWLVDPDKNYTLPQTQNILLATTAPLLTSQNIALNTAKLGLHRLVYGIYSDDMLLCAGSAAFDMGEAVVLGIATDQAYYPDGREPITAAVDLYGAGPATLELFQDGQLAASQQVSLAGFTTIQQNIPVNSPGRHTLKAVLTSGGLTSTKERSIVYGSGLPDLSLRMFIDQALAGAKMKLNVTVTNQGKSSSSATTLNLYDGPVTNGVVLATFDVKSLAPGEYQTYIFEFNCLGKAGANSVSAWIDPAGQVFEFNKGNNGVQIAFTVPDLDLETTLGKDVYTPGETVLITGKITNLSRNQVSDYILETEVKDTSGNQVFKDSKNPPAIGGLASVSVDTSWVIEASLPEGVYTISQTLQGRDALTRKIIALKADQDFSIASQVIHKRVETGEAIQYNLTLTPVRGFSGEVSLSLQNWPPGYTALFSSNSVSLANGPAQTTLNLIPSSQEKVGAYTMTIFAVGGGRSHNLSLGLDLTDFQITAAPAAQSIKQLDEASCIIAIRPLNGFDSPVTLELDALPRGMKGSMSASQVTLSNEVKLTLTTSKWLLPGMYDLNITAKGKVLNHTATVTLMVDKNPAITPGVVTVPGPMNKPVINSFSSKGVLLSQFQAFDRRSSTHIATGDVDGDGMDEIITGVGWAKGRSPSFVGIFKKDGTPVALLGTEQKSGITIAAGDIDGDWVEEVAVGYHYHPNRISEIEDDINDWLLGNEWDEDGYCARYHRGGLGIIKVYKVMGREFIDTGLVLYPYESEGYRGTPNIAIADVDGDGKPELITAPGPDPSAPARIKIFKIDTSEGMGKWKVAFPMFDVIVPFEKIKVPKKEDKKDGGWSVHIEGYGANIAAGDLDGDGKAEIIVGAGPDPRKNGQVIILRMVDGQYHMESFIAYEGSRYGVYVAAGDLDGDGKAEIITGLGPGPKNKSAVRIFRGDGTLMGEFQAYPESMKFGVRVSGGGVGE